MSAAARRWLSGIGLVGFAAVLLCGMAAMPGSGDAADRYRALVVDTAIEQVGAANTVSAVLFDLRALDTLGEALALFAAAAGLQLLLRQLEGEERQVAPRDAASDRPERATSDAVRVVALGFVGPVVAASIYLAVRGHVTVGAGFQAGALAATAIALVYLAGRYAAMHRVVPEGALDVGESLGAGGAAALGLLGMVVAGGLFANLGGPGEFATLGSSGTVALLSVFVAVEAAAASTLIVTEFQRQTFELRPGGDGD